MITSAQMRAGRALAGMSQGDFAADVNVNVRTLMDFESGKRKPIPATLKALADGLEKHGVILVPNDDQGEGVRFASPQPL